MTVAAPCKPPRPGITGVFSLSPPGSRPRRNNGHPNESIYRFHPAGLLSTGYGRRRAWRRVGYRNWYGKVPSVGSVVCTVAPRSAARSGAAARRQRGATASGSARPPRPASAITRATPTRATADADVGLRVTPRARTTAAAPALVVSVTL